MNEKRIIKEWTTKAPSWSQIVEHYRSRPGLVLWLSNRLPVLRGEIEDTPEPGAVEILEQDVA
jgi:hypothetical protein